MRSSVVLASFVVLGVGCGPQWAVVPRGGAPLITANQGGVYFTAFAEQWDGDPHDLADYVTPIAVDLYNGTGTEVRVSYADFSLTNAAGQRIQAISPYDTPTAARDLPGGATLADDDETLKLGPLFAGPLEGPAGSILMTSAHGGGGGGGHGGGFGGGHGSVRGGMGRGYGGPRGWHGGGFGRPTHWGRGFLPHGGLRRWWGPGALYWGGPWAYGPGYGLWVANWATYGYEQPSPDVLELALPEGVLEPGAHINGYLFFRKATGPGVGGLGLTWTTFDARTNTQISVDHVDLDVVHR